MGIGSVADMDYGSEFDLEAKVVESSRKKRPLELDEEDEADDTLLEFGEDSRAPIRRGRKEGRRVSGVYREIKSLQSIGQNAVVLENVFDRMSTKSVMVDAGQACNMWYIIACRIFRKRLRNNSFLRLWRSGQCSQYLWMQWALHFHEELLGGEDPTDEPMEEEDKRRKTEPFIPAIQALFTIGSRHAFNQFTNENALLPWKQEHVYALCQNAVFTAPDYSFTDTFDSKFGLDMAVETLFIPKSKHFTVKSFGLEYNKQTFTPEEVLNKVHLSQDDTGPDQCLRAVFLLKYTETEATQSFIFELQKMGVIPVLDGCPEELGCNQVKPPAPNEPTPATLGAGFSFYCGPGANATVYGMDCLKPSAKEILQKMKNQVDSAKNGFCFVIYYDGRPCIPPIQADLDTSMEWESAEKPASMTADVLREVRSIMPRTPLLGINSIHPVNIICQNGMSNMDQDSPFNVSFAFLLLTYQD